MKSLAMRTVERWAASIRQPEWDELGEAQREIGAVVVRYVGYPTVERFKGYPSALFDLSPMLPDINSVSHCDMMPAFRVSYRVPEWAMRMP